MDEYEGFDDEDDELDVDGEDGVEPDEVLRTMTLPPVDQAEIGELLEEVGISETFRALIERTKFLNQIHGDADPMVADLASDIESLLRVAKLEWDKAPSIMLFGILSRMPQQMELKRIDEILLLLQQRRAFLLGRD